MLNYNLNSSDNTKILMFILQFKSETISLNTYKHYKKKYVPLMICLHLQTKYIICKHIFVSDLASNKYRNSTGDFLNHSTRV